MVNYQYFMPMLTMKSVNHVSPLFAY